MDAMHFLRASVVVALVVLSLCGSGAADTLVIRNRMHEEGTLRVACHAVLDRTGWNTVPRGGSYTVRLPAGAMVDLVPARCSGMWDEEERGFPVRFAAYNYFRDHPTCRKVCEMEAKDGGWYIKNATSREWRLVHKFYRPFVYTRTQRLLRSVSFSD